MSDLTLSGVVWRVAGIAFRKQRGGQRVAGDVVGALQFAGDASGELRLDDFEIVFGQRGRKFVVREQLRAALKIFRQNLQ